MSEITRIITPCRCGKCIYCEFGGNPPAQIIEKETELAEARADADHWKSECNALQRMAHEARAEIEALKRVNVALNEEIKIQRAYVAGRDNTIERKERLIEQMREALQMVRATSKSFLPGLTWQAVIAALKSAERSES